MTATSWIQCVAEDVSRIGAIVRVAVVRAEGSTPRECGAAMLIGPACARDTIGGGALELAATAHARTLLARLDEAAPANRPWHRECRDFALGPALGQCCGGYTRLLFEVFTARERPVLEALGRDCQPGRTLLLRPIESGVPLAAVADRSSECGWPPAVKRSVGDMLSGARPHTPALLSAGKGASAWFIEPLVRSHHRLFIYGAGHVGRALVRAVAELPFCLTWVDTAQARFPASIPGGVAAVVSTDPAGLAASAPVGAFHVVMTYSHALDLAVCSSLLRRGDFRHLGLIGSATKRARFAQRLRALGIAETQLSRLVCPIGIPGIGGKEPAIIAVAVAAELLQLVSAGRAPSPQPVGAVSP